MQLDNQNRSEGGKMPVLILRADDRAEVRLKAAMTDQITESKRS